nr:hypothetical protein YSBCXYJI_YSBCXYJI_CDS_0046 [Caudoviricetes sp.]
MFINRILKFIRFTSMYFSILNNILFSIFNYIIITSFLHTQCNT